MATGRKRFLQDLDELRALSKKGWNIHGIFIKGVRAGDEEGQIEFRAEDEDDPIASVNLLISDTSAYPTSHTCYAFALDDDVHETVTNVLENLSSSSPRPLKDTLTRLVTSLGSALGFIDDEDEEMEGTQSSGDDNEFGAIEDTYGAAHIAEQTKALKRDFIEVVANGFRPGLVRFGSNDFVVITSLPLVKFPVPPTALAAWDGRLISPDMHLTLLISGFRGAYPPLNEQGHVASAFAKLKFNVGLSAGKPSKEAVEAVTRDFAMKEEEIFVPDPPAPEIPEWDEDDPETWVIPPEKPPTPEPIDPGRFERFSLSTSLNSALNDMFLPVLQLRLKYGIGWAGAELLHAEITARQITEADALDIFSVEVVEADDEERFMKGLPLDPLIGVRQSGHLNLPLIAYGYLVRRFLLCPRFCLVCHQKVKVEYDALKPYVCDKGLCAFQFYAHERGTSLEYEILHNSTVVDLLVSLACCSALEGQLCEGLPIGIGLRVPPPGQAYATQTVASYYNGGQVQTAPVDSAKMTIDNDGLVDFDALSLPEQRGAIADMLNKIPKISEMNKWLKRKTPSKAKGKQTIRDLDRTIPAAAWTILRWCIASCTSYIEEITSSADRLQGVDAQYHQFRFSVGSPQAEAKFRAAVDTATKADSNAKKYPTIYAWHGSLLRNWHSIIRQGLNFNVIANGRAFGNGVYFGKDGSTSAGYARSGSNRWRNSELNPNTALAIAELVNLPKQFVSTSPHYVVGETSWIFCRYLLVSSGSIQQVVEGDGIKTSYLKHDPAHPITLNNKPIQIPLRINNLEAQLETYKRLYRDPQFDEEDKAVFDYAEQVEPPPPPPPKDDWVHNPKWVEPTDYQLLPPPVQASTQATLALQKELRAIINEQNQAYSKRDLGYYISPEVMGDNLFQWMVELHSFDPSLPLAKDMKKNGVNSLLFEIRFPPTFPHQPPFFRLIKPRLLPFLQGGGGHITAGGSICMDLLVADGWLPSYNIAAVLLQIRMAISSTEPRPARLAQNWQIPYGAQEALDGFVRAANTHGWTVPNGTHQLVLR